MEQKPPRRPPPKPPALNVREEQARRPQGDPPPLRREGTPGIPYREPPSEPKVFQEPLPAPPQLPAHRASQPDSDAPEDVTKFRLRVLEKDVDGLGGKLDQVERKVDHVAGKVGELERSQGLRLGAIETALADRKGADQRFATLVGGIVGVISAAIALVGQQLNKPDQPPPAPVVRSAFDRALDACAKLEDDKAKGACVARVTADSMATRK